MKRSSAKDRTVRRRGGNPGGHGTRPQPHGPAAEPPPSRLLDEIEELRSNLEQERLQMETVETTLIQTQHELELSREHYVHLYESAPVGYLTLDMDGTVFDANATAETMLGWERGQLFGRMFSNRVLPEDLPALRQHFWRTRREEKPVTVELRLKAVNGVTPVIQLVSTYGGRAVDDRPQFRIVLTDVTERRRAEEQRSESERRFRTMADGAPVLIWLAGPDKGRTWFNQPWLSFTGRGVEDEVGIGWAKNIHRDDVERCLLAYTRAFDARQEFQLEYRLRRHDGKWRWLLDHGVPLGETLENYAGFIGSCVDITDRRRAEAELREKEAELRFVADHTTVCLTRCTLDLRYKFVNRAYAELLGLPPEQIVGRPIREILGEAAFQTIQPHVERVLSGLPVECETELFFPGSGPRFVHANYQPETDSSGAVMGWVAAFIDITEHKQEERWLKVSDLINGALAEASSLPEVAPRILQTICELAGWDVGVLWLVDRPGKELYCAEFWHRATDPVPEFEADTRLRRYGPGQGLAGHVWSVGRSKFVPDLFKESSFLRTGVAFRAGLRSGFCFPIKQGKQQVTGLIQCFSRQHHRFKPGFFNHLTTVGDKLGQFIESKLAETALQHSEERTRRIIETALDAVITTDASDVITDWNPRAEQSFGWKRQEVLGRKMAETLIAPSHRAGYENNLRQYLDAGASPMVERRVELTTLHRSGREFPVEMAMTSLALEGGLAFCAFVRDITDRKAAEEMLRRAHDELEQRVHERTTELLKANQQLGTAFDLMNDLYHRAPCGYHSVDATGRFVEINDTALHWLGYKREQLVGRKTVFDIETPASRKRNLEAFEQLKQGGNIHDLQLEFVRKDGSVLTVLLNATAILNADGQLTRSRSAYVDVTGRVRTEQALANSEARLQAILDFSPAIMFVKDLQGHYRLVNREFQRAFGFSPDRVAGRTDAELFPREIAAVFGAHDRLVLRTGKPHSFEESALHTDGRHDSVVVKFPLRDSGGKMTALGGMAFDITERKKAEAALRASEIKFRGFVESAPDSVVITDAKGRIQLVNAQTERLFGYDRAEMLNRPIEMLMPARFRRGHLSHRSHYAAAQRARDMGTGLDLFGRRKNGDEFPIEISISPLDSESGQLMCAAIRDISVRRKYEKQLRESREHYLELFKEAQAAHRNMKKLSQLVLRAQEKERKRISRELHDEVGQSLTAMSMTLKGVKRDGAGDAATEQRKLDDVQRLLRTTMNTVHDFARELRPSILDEFGLLAALRSTVQNTADRTRLRVRLRADPEAERLGAEEKLVVFRVVQESLNNVVKHAMASRVRVTVSKAKGEIVLRVADNGRSFLYDKGGAMTRGRLGLMGMKERVNLVNGEFTISGRPGRGTTVQVQLPLKFDEPLAPAKGAEEGKVEVLPSDADATTL